MNRPLPGKIGRALLGTTVFFGMVVATAIAIIFIPLFFRLIQGDAEREPAVRVETAEER